MSQKRPDSNAGFYRALALVGQVGFFIALPMVLGALGGRFLDQTLHDKAPLATILGLLLGLAAGVALVVRLVSRLPDQ
jgi:ATP synthase protein I